MNESRDELLSYSKKIIKRPEDGGWRTFQSRVTMESILKGHELILELKLGECANRWAIVPNGAKCSGELFEIPEILSACRDIVYRDRSAAGWPVWFLPFP
jgi:hypothetical protein